PAHDITGEAPREARGDGDPRHRSRDPTLSNTTHRTLLAVVPVPLGRYCGSGRSTAGSVAAVELVAEVLLALLDLAGGDALQGGEGAAGVLGDPHVDHGRGGELLERRAALGIDPGEARDAGSLGIVGEAEVFVHVPLGERATDLGHLVEAQ